MTNSLREALARRGVTDPSAGLSRLQPYDPQGGGDPALQATLPYGSLAALLAATDWPRDWPANYCDSPDNQESDGIPWGGSPNGVTHDDRYWYVATVFRGSDVVDLSQVGRAVSSGILRIPLGQPSWAPDKTAAMPALDERGQPLLGPYRHYGDLDYHEGRLYVPVEPDDLGQVGAPGKILVFDTDLALVCSGTLDHLDPSGNPVQLGAPWCAIDPGSGLLYSSSFGDDGGTDALCVYRPTVVPGVRLGLDFVGRLLLRDPAGNPKRLSRIQGGAFSASGHLYLVVDDGTGVSGIDVLTGRLGARLVVNYNHPAEELEGLTIWPVVADQCGGAAQIHVLQTRSANLHISNDTVWFKHYAVTPAEANLI